ncbi:CinA family protein [Vibrio sp. JC009]|uniref:CinA family protein n=1 Tax=Vibrio sp. JC009 TaxID=2912314 RepID=UPI0023AF0E02|nr:nicotinamide-nucleotide amidohydrolase family protein [Vibrio sp. JC009]WED21371.1 CinA family protein [Vibrio sp. JC009]
MDKLKKLSEEIGLFLQQEKQILVSAESCTGGGIASAVTDISGSSVWFDRAFITYSNDAKMEMLGVNAKTLTMNGAVSQPVVAEMAFGALKNSNGTVSVAVSGIAGPTGGTEDKPVGTVWFAWRYLDKEYQECCLFEGDRAEVRYQACVHALEGVIKVIKG